MSFKSAFQAAHHYRALKKCLKHALLTYRYGREALQGFSQDSKGIAALLPLVKQLTKPASKSAVQPDLVTDKE